MRKFSISKLSQIIQEKRSELNITQEELGKLIGINKFIIEKLESQKIIPSITQLKILLKELCIELDEIIEEESPDNVFITLNREAKTDKEREYINKFISMMVCLRQHKRLRRKLK